jgi:DHA1 family tetracycline resistance protein-like MFS transporter
MQFLSAPAIGALSDRIGRRPVLLTGILGLAVMMFVPAFTDSLWLILASRLVGGYSEGSEMDTLVKTIIDKIEADHRLELLETPRT